MLGATTVRYMLDTNICIYVINARPPEVLDRFLVHEAEGLGISAITASELYWGASKSGSARNLALLEQFISPLTVFDYDLAAARRYGELRAQLEKRGKPIGPLDQQIAAHALALGVTLVTNNLREFERVPGLQLENWA
ncbi:MAG: type II toxin-antitoxin system VapC family toxin [Proteobacteria bacterium]|jgi:tRNA(fMet)-specific endonuclease VapC|nr:type II toxin-antitoxin system VapC family toxin [Ramlibacter sp.]MCA0214052.1 type II toxin-antitoxin system VapC family toxin [Pseudomonadota bacterium]